MNIAIDDVIVGFIGFGEAAQAFSALRAPRKLAYDIKTDQRDIRAAKLAEYQVWGASCAIEGLGHVEKVVKQSNVIFSLVPADQSLSAALNVAQYISKNTMYFDMNSTAPETKKTVCALIENAGGRYVDAAIMAPVQPAQLSVPVLLAGQYAQDALVVLDGFGFSNLRAVGHEVGRASSIKMIRSVMIKGMEALTAECALAALKAGVVEEVFGSMGEVWLDADGGGKADYNLDRMMVHGERRAAEMREVCKTLSDLGIEPKLSQGTVSRHAMIGGLHLKKPAQGLSQKLTQITALLPENEVMPEKTNAKKEIS